MSVGNKVQYVATDEARQVIPWVRSVDALGVVTEYKVRSFTNDVSRMNIRTVDCIDCHNRPAHIYQTPDAAVNLAIYLGKIDRSLPWIKTNAVAVLTRPYLTRPRPWKESPPRWRKVIRRTNFPARSQASAPPSMRCSRFTATISFPR